MNATLFAALMLAEVTSATTIYDANTNIGQWLNSSAFFGIFFMIVFFMTCYFVLGLLAQIQTPRILLDKCLDWGKIEKIEE